MKDLNNIEINAKDSGAVNYVRARYAIHESMPNRRAKRDAKLVVVDFLKGTVDQHMVVFPDGTKAKF